MQKFKEWLTREEIQKRYSYSLYSLNLAIASGKVRKETNKCNGYLKSGPPGII